VGLGFVQLSRFVRIAMLRSYGEQCASGRATRIQIRPLPGRVPLGAILGIGMTPTATRAEFARTHVGLVSFLGFTLPRAIRLAETLDRPVCCVAVLRDRSSGAATVQLTGSAPPPATRPAIRALLRSMPPHTILAWL
jgi:hypothetical protein